MFRGSHYFLSNMYPCVVTYNNVTYQCSEAAYVAAKCPGHEQQISKLNGYEAKKIGRQLPIRSDWDTIKLQVMYEIVRAKFQQNPALTTQLIATGKEILTENNYWGDTFWGVCKGTGQNNLGKILMQIRRAA